jgi:OOP family OmpA-OmpF porin
MKRIAIAILLSAIAAPTFADGYIGINVGQNKYDRTLPDDTSDAVGILGGISFNRFFAVELGYIDLGSVDLAPGSSLKGNAWSLSAVGFLPLGDNFSLFAKAGAAQTEITAAGLSQTNNGATYGAGGQFNITPAIGIRVSYDRYKVGGGAIPEFNTNVTSIGALFQF